MKRRFDYIFAIAALLLAAGCQKEDIENEACYGETVVRFAPSIVSIGGGNGLTKSAAGCGNQAELMLSSSDGSLTLPMTCETIEGIDLERASSQVSDSIATKGSLINDPGSGTPEAKSLGIFATSIDGTFWVTAWDNAVTPTRIIPDATARAFTGGYVSGSDANGWYQKVMYRGASSSNYWMTVQPYTPAGVSATIADDEYLWKKDETKTFYAYANLPESGASITNTSAAGQTLTYDVPATAAAQTDILMGIYSGNGNSGSPAVMTGTAGIVFSHPLTAVKFKLGTLSGVSTFVVNSISIENVHSSGTSEMTPASADESDPKDRFTWTPTGTTTVSQTISTQPAAAGDQIGEAFLLIPQTFSSSSTARIAFNVTIDGTTTLNLYYPLLSCEWKAGYTNTYTIGYEINYSYVFTLAEGETSGNVSFANTTSAETSSIQIVSTKETESGVSSACEWKIKSVQVGSGDAEMINATSFEDKGGLRASLSGSGELAITASERKNMTTASNDFWTNKDGISGDTEGNGWSPKSWSDKGTIDLSKYNFQDETTDNLMTTANCYIIRHAGTYQLPLVYGNAIVNGAFNEQSYYPNCNNDVTDGDDPTKNHRLVKFVNSTGAKIENPFIENAAGCGGSDLKYAVVWQDKAEVVKNLQIVDGASAGTAGSYTIDNVRYLKFTISQDDICQNNALICVYKDADSNGKYDEGEAVWSWHIWTTNDPALLSEPLAFTNWSNIDYYFFPLYTLGFVEGALYPERDEVKIVLVQSLSGKEIIISVNQPLTKKNSLGCWYQFGRKDPMCMIDSPDEGNFFIEPYGTGTTLAGAICTPGTFYQSIAETDWCTATYNNLWTGKHVGPGDVDDGPMLIKTVYDPSPVGYKVPASAAFSAFDSDCGINAPREKFNVEGEYDNGWYFYAKPQKQGNAYFFPACGYRRNTGKRVVGGRYHTAISRDSDYSYGFSFKDSYVSHYGYDSRSCGRSVRPVHEP